MKENTTFDIGGYQVAYRSSGGWTVVELITIQSGKRKGEPDERLVGYYSDLASSMEGLLREKLTKLGAGSAQEILERVRETEARLRAEWTARVVT